jgi:hypothetical protein
MAWDRLSHRGMANCSPGPSRSINNTTASFGNLTRAWVWRSGGWTPWLQGQAGRAKGFVFVILALALASVFSSAPVVSNQFLGTGGRATRVAAEERGTAPFLFFSVYTDDTRGAEDGLCDEGVAIPKGQPSFTQDLLLYKRMQGVEEGRGAKPMGRDQRSKTKSLGSDAVLSTIEPSVPRWVANFPASMSSAMGPGAEKARLDFPGLKSGCSTPPSPPA